MSSLWKGPLFFRPARSNADLREHNDFMTSLPRDLPTHIYKKGGWLRQRQTMGSFSAWKHNDSSVRSVLPAWSHSAHWLEKGHKMLWVPPKKYGRRTRLAQVTLRTVCALEETFRRHIYSQTLGFWLLVSRLWGKTPKLDIKTQGWRSF